MRTGVSMLLAGVFACGAMAAQVELTYTYEDKHEEKKTIEVAPDAKGVVTLTVKRSGLPPAWSGCRCCPSSRGRRGASRATT
jgi:hypothetical protein